MAFTPDDDQPPPSFAETCQVPGCTNPVAEWGGRGRKPTKCEEHKSGRTPSDGTVSRRDKNAPSAMAYRAARVLAQANTFVAAIMSGFFPMTAEAITHPDVRNDFIENAAFALDADPALCKRILRGGTDNAKLALLFAYGGLIAAVTPVAITEVRLIREREREAS